MQKILIVLCLTLIPSVTAAYNPIFAEPEAAYEAVVLEGDVFTERNLLGDLEGYPDLFEFSSEVAFTLQLQLKQKEGEQAVPFGLLLVRQNDEDGGVTEVARQNVSPADWGVTRYSSLGMTFLEAPLLVRDLTPGTYRVEVSTPDNIGEYMLVIGDETVRKGPWGKFFDVFKTQYHFGVFPLFALLSPWVTVPLLLLLTGYLWFKRKWDSIKI